MRALTVARCRLIATATRRSAPRAVRALSADASSGAGPLAEYERLIASGEVSRDEHQIAALALLQRLHDELAAYEPPALDAPAPGGGAAGVAGSADGGGGVLGQLGALFANRATESVNDEAASGGWWARLTGGGGTGGGGGGDGSGGGGGDTAMMRAALDACLLYTSPSPRD